MKIWTISGFALASSIARRIASRASSISRRLAPKSGSGVAASILVIPLESRARQGLDRSDVGGHKLAILVEPEQFNVIGAVENLLRRRGFDQVCKVAERSLECLGWCHGGR